MSGSDSEKRDKKEREKRKCMKKTEKNKANVKISDSEDFLLENLFILDTTEITPSSISSVNSKKLSKNSSKRKHRHVVSENDLRRSARIKKEGTPPVLAITAEMAKKCQEQKIENIVEEGFTSDETVEMRIEITEKEEKVMKKKNNCLETICDVTRTEDRKLAVEHNLDICDFSIKGLTRTHPIQPPPYESIWVNPFFNARSGEVEFTPNESENMHKATDILLEPK